MDELQRSVASTFVDLGGAAERLQAFRGETARGGQVADRLVQVCEEAGQAEKKLDATIGTAKSTAESIERASSAANERVGKLDSHHAAACTLTERTKLYG